MAEETSPAAPLAIYVHWPYCRARCPYCDFNVHVRRSVDHDRWRRALTAELEHYHRGTPDRVVESVYFGGGTPSLMEPETVEAVLGNVRRLWAVADGIEVSLEANPSSADRAHFESFRAAGVTRLSLGVQSLDDRALSFLGRDHDRGQALEALSSAREVFPVLSFDLIYARPGQSAAAWRRELGEAISFEADHVSLYQLTFEPGTAFHAALGRGTIQSLGDGEQAALYEIAQEDLAAAGLPAYEVSNHARPGNECRHNLAYWRAGEYLGVGPGAHGRIDSNGERVATVEIRSPERWLAAVESRGHAILDETILAAGDRRNEILLMGLRLAEGVSRARFREGVRADFESALDPARLGELCRAGLLALDSHGLRASAAGRERLDSVLSWLLG